MNKPSRFPEAKSFSSPASQMRKQDQPHARNLQVAQPKIAQGQQKPTQQVAPPVYKPQPTPQVLQRKAAVKQQPLVGQAKPAPAVPPVYHPQPIPKVLQRKESHDRLKTDPVKAYGRQMAAPPAYRPQPTPKCLQPKMSNALPQSPQAPQAYRPQLVPKVLQAKIVMPEKSVLAQSTKGQHPRQPATNRSTLNSHSTPIQRKMLAQPNRNKSCASTPFPGYRQRPNGSVLQLSREKQPLISNYFGGGGEPQLLEDHPELELPVDAEQVKITGEGAEFEAKDHDGKRKVGELVLYEDNQGNYWINNINVPVWARRRGIAVKLLAKAIEEHGTIYASTQTADDDTAIDTRHLTAEGSDLVRGCIRKGMNVVIADPVT